MLADGLPTTLARAPSPISDYQLLDEELDETFPASDPVPWSHRVD